MDNKGTKKRRRLRRAPNTETIRERSNKAAAAANKTSRFKRIKTRIANFFRKLINTGKREIYLPLPDNRFGSFLNKRRSLMPRYFINSWRELKQVSWPSRKETWQLTFAVFIFAFVFGLLITVTDYGLDKLFKAVLVK